MNRTSYDGTDWKFSNFKIPIKTFNNDSNPVPNPTLKHRTLDDQYDPREPNIHRYTPGGTSRPFHQQNNFRPYQQQQNNSGPPRSDYDDLPQVDSDRFQRYSTPHFQSNHGSFASGQNSFNANRQPRYNYQANQLKRPREVPKNNSNSMKYADTFPHHSDPTLPRELTEQFQPLFCKLCNAQLSSNSMAKLHYKSKNHEKKVRRFLTDYSERTGEPLHERAQTGASKKQKLEEENDPKYFHCNVCDLSLTGKLHAESHYMGRNHQKAMAGNAPAGKGYFNDEGKWVRRTTVAVSSDRDNFGLDFAQSPAEIPTTTTTATTTATTTTATATKDLIDKKLHCEMCDVKVTSEQQMEVHLSGQKHKKRLQQVIEFVDDDDGIKGVPENNILSTLSSNVVPSGDLSVYRTPTGYYYCNPCNLTLNSEIQFKQHLGSKKHRKKASGSKE